MENNRTLDKVANHFANLKDFEEDAFPFTIKFLLIDDPSLPNPGNNADQLVKALKECAKQV